jgi:hypothetical protein
MSRVVADCRDMPSDIGCTLTISGEPDEVVDRHGHDDGPELREAIRSGLRPERVTA